MRLPTAMPSDALAASAINLLSANLAGAAIRTGSRTTRGSFPRRRMSFLSGESLDLSQFAFGVTIAGAVATVAAGYVYRGHRDVIAVATADVTITATDQFIPLAVNVTAGTAAIETPTTTLPQPDSTTFRIWLVKCTLSGGAAEIATIGHVGNLYLPGVGA